MNQVGRKIYFDKTTGNVILATSEMQGYVEKTTPEQDISTFKLLSERVRDTFDVIELEFGQFAQDFNESNGFRVNVLTKNIEFSYPDPSEPNTPQIFQKPLSIDVAELKEQLTITQQALDELILGGI